MKKFLVIASIVFAVISLPAMALDLQIARGQGIVGEKLDGFVAAIKTTPEATALVSQVNELRKVEYAKISKQNGQPIDVVAKIAAVEIIKKLPSGAKYQDGSGKWLAK